MRAAPPDLFVVEADEAADRALLDALADWAERYTPLVALDPPNGLFLDIPAAPISSPTMAGTGRQSSSPIAPPARAPGLFRTRGRCLTAGAAWALARYGRGGRIPAGEEAEAIGELPVAALRVDTEVEALLDRLGLKRVGQLIGKPRAPLAARFGIGLVTRLDQALGRLDEGGRHAARRRSFPPNAASPSRSSIRPRCLGRWRRSPRRSRRRLSGTGSARAFSKSPSFAPTARFPALRSARRRRCAKRKRWLGFSERLSALGSDWDAGFGFDMVRLAVICAEPLGAAQIDLSGAENESAGLSRLYDRLGARLGTGRITRFEPLDTHIPEPPLRRSRWLEKAARNQSKADFSNLPLEGSKFATRSWKQVLREGDGTGRDAARPLRLFPQPESVEVLAEVPEDRHFAFVGVAACTRFCAPRGRSASRRNGGEWRIAGG